MTSISVYLQIEQFDLTEPAGFYLPGAEDWAHSYFGTAGIHRHLRHQMQDEPDDLTEIDDEDYFQ